MVSGELAWREILFGRNSLDIFLELGLETAKLGGCERDQEKSINTQNRSDRLDNLQFLTLSFPQAHLWCPLQWLLYCVTQWNNVPGGDPLIELIEVGECRLHRSNFNLEHQIWIVAVHIAVTSSPSSVITKKTINNRQRDFVWESSQNVALRELR